MWGPGHWAWKGQGLVRMPLVFDPNVVPRMLPTPIIWTWFIVAISLVHATWACGCIAITCHQFNRNALCYRPTSNALRADLHRTETITSERRLNGRGYSIGCYPLVVFCELWPISRFAHLGVACGNEMIKSLLCRVWTDWGCLVWRGCGPLLLPVRQRRGPSHRPR